MHVCEIINVCCYNDTINIDTQLHLYALFALDKFDKQTIKTAKININHLGGMDTNKYISVQQYLNVRLLEPDQNI